MAVLLMAGSLTGQERCTLPKGVTVASDNGGRIRTDLGYGISLNERSTLLREAVVVHDSRLPLDFVGTPVLQMIYDDRDFTYNTDVTVVAAEDVTAFAASFITFNVFGEQVANLGATEVVDIPTGASRRSNGAGGPQSTRRKSILRQLHISGGYGLPMAKFIMATPGLCSA